MGIGSMSVQSQRVRTVAKNSWMDTISDVVEGHYTQEVPAVHLLADIHPPSLIPYDGLGGTRGCGSCAAASHRGRAAATLFSASAAATRTLIAEQLAEQHVGCWWSCLARAIFHIFFPTPPRLPPSSSSEATTLLSPSPSSASFLTN